ncbi:MAG TPA: ABC transporter ATP-binding protein [Thermoanaerobaculia bacterium]|nr:ABC transporter ATP-binding protein [Thermoanaerobaculia bacterium]
MNVMVADGVTVRYGKKTAVDRVSLAVAEGSVYALLGRNGAGKSSLVRALLGMLQPNAGTIALFGEDVWRRRARLMDRVGVVSEEADAPPEMRVRDLGWLTSRLYSRWTQSAFDSRVDRFAISPKTRYADLSKGQKKQVALALALATSPKLLVLDDPTLGLDVVARKSLFEEVIADMAERGLTVFITTHDLSAIETLADRVGVLQNGKLVLDDELENLKARFRRVRYAGAPAAALAMTAASTRAWGTGTEAIVTDYDDVAFERFRDAAETSESVPMTLEEIFIAVAGEEQR